MNTSMTTQKRAFLREWRLAKGLTQPELAKRVGTVKSEISRLERGSRRMTLDWMSSLSQAMGIQVEDMMELPPQGYGAVSPAPQIIRPGDFESFHVGEVELGLRKGHFRMMVVEGGEWSNTFLPGDVLLYDSRRTATSIPGLYVMDFDGEIVVRRLTIVQSGKQIECDDYDPVPLPDDAKVIGKVVARAHRV